jgi:hypothetical protein
MGMVIKPRYELLKELNAAFTEKRIEKTARVLRKLPERAALGEMSEALGFIPERDRARFRRTSGSVPAFLAAALAQGLRAHLRAIGRAHPKAVRINIRDGRNFALEIKQMSTHTAVTLTMRRK